MGKYRGLVHFRCPKCGYGMKRVTMFSSILLECLRPSCKHEIDERDYKGRGANRANPADPPAGEGEETNS